MKISIIIASYNPNITFLEKTIDSILNQTVKDIEIIVIDDYSKSLISEDLNKYSKNKYISIYRNEKNLERSASRNKWVNIAKWEYIAFLDDDDLWIDKTKLEQQIHFLENNKEYGLCGTNGIYIDKDDKKINDYNIQVFNDADIRNKILLYNPFIFSSIVIRKKIFQNVWWFNEKINMWEDYDLYLRVWKNHKLAILNFSLVWYRLAVNSTYKNQLKIKIQCLKNVFTYWKYYPNCIKSLLIWLVLFVLPYSIAQKINWIIPKKIKALLYK